MFGPRGSAPLDDLELALAYSQRLESLRDLIAVYTREIDSLDRRIAVALKEHAGYRAIQAINGIGPVLAAVFVAEIGDVSRFPDADRLCSWAGSVSQSRRDIASRHRRPDRGAPPA